MRGLNPLARIPPAGSLHITPHTARTRLRSLTSCIFSSKHAIKTQQTAIDTVLSQHDNSLIIAHGAHKKKWRYPPSKIKRSELLSPMQMKHKKYLFFLCVEQTASYVHCITRPMYTVMATFRFFRDKLIDVFTHGIPWFDRIFQRVWGSTSVGNRGTHIHFQRYVVISFNHFCIFFPLWDVTNVYFLRKQCFQSFVDVFVFLCVFVFPTSKL